MALKSERSRIRFKDIESVPAYDPVHRAGPGEPSAEPPANEERRMNSLPLPVGEELRQTREEAGLDLVDVAAHLRIRSNFLAALEEGRPDALPGITYAIGYVRTYAGFLGLDPDSAVRRFKEEAAGLNSKTQLVFPSPAPEGRVPGLALVLVAALLAGGAYGGWYWVSEQDGGLRGLVPAVPERLARLIEGEAPSVLPVPAPAATTAPAVVPPAAPASTAIPPAATPPAATPQTATPQTAAAPTAAAPTTPAPAANTPAAPTSAATIPSAGAPGAGTPAAATQTATASAAIIPTPSRAGGPDVASPGAARVPAPAAPAPAAPGIGPATAPAAATAPGLAAAQPGTGSAAPTATTTTVPGSGATPPRPAGETVTAVAPAGSTPSTAAPVPSPTTATTPPAGDATPSAETVADTDVPDVTAPPEPAAPVAQAEPGATQAAIATPRASQIPDAGAGVPAAPRIAGLIGSSEAAVPAPSGPVERVMIRATGDSWVQVRDADGTALFTRVLRQGDVYRVPNQAGLKLATGNAGALEVLVDGAPAPGLGDFGEVVRNVALDPTRLAAGTATGPAR